jgi:uncharacterized protein YjbI with pentapeptide repeats
MEELVYKAHSQLTRIVLILGIFISVVSFSMLRMDSTPEVTWIMSFLQNLGAGAIGAFLVIRLVESNLNQIQLMVQKQKEKDDLIFKMSNPNDNGIALEALRLLRELNHIGDGSLRGKKLHWAKLENADLKEADLREANLGGADLQSASLWHASMQGTILGSAKLQKANLAGAKLQGADLHGANLTGAILDKAVFDENTTLPDGSKWTSETNMEKFTTKAVYKAEFKRYA